MSFIKLTEPGSAHVLRVQTVNLNKSGNWPDYEFSDGTDTINVPQKAADRQLARLNVSNAFELVGATLKVSRSDKPGANNKLFWNLDIVNAAAAKPAAPTKRLTADAAAKAPPHTGPLIPGLDDTDPSDPWELDEDARGELMEREMRELEAQNASIPPTPREAAQLTGAEAKRAEWVDTYTALYGDVLASLIAAHKDANATAGSRTEDKVPLTSDTVQAATFSIFKTWRDTGLVK